MYGSAGSFRHQPHGCEYRSTSNYIFSSPELMTWAYNQTIRALKFINLFHTQLPEIMQGNALETIINTKHIKACEALCKEWNLKVIKNELILKDVRSEAQLSDNDNKVLTTNSQSIIGAINEISQSKTKIIATAPR